MEFDEYGFSPFPDFFRFFNSHDHSQRLVIPKSYRKYYPTPLPQTAVLRKVDGKFWNVKWTITQDETISFEDDWHKFVIDNGILEGDMVLFTYDGFRTFWVRILRNGVVVKSESPINIQEISDDEDETNGGCDVDHDKKEEDINENMIISLSLGSSSSDDDDYDDEDDEDDEHDDTMICEVNKTPNGSSIIGESSRRSRGALIADPETYLDDQMNPFFTSNSACSRPVLVIAMQVRKDYELKFGSTIYLIDKFGKLKRKLGQWKDRVVVNRWDEFYKRNHAKPGDTVICEILREGGVVHSIKVHFIKH